MTALRKLIAAFCLVALLAVAVNPVTPGILVALLAPLFFFFAPVAIALTGVISEDQRIPARRFFAVFASRGPPNC
jgi:hypothetical protein